MYRYIIVESKQNKRLDDDVISLFSDVLEPSLIIKKDDQAIMYFEHAVDVSFEDVILNVMSDTLTDLRVYVSFIQSSENEREKHVHFMKCLIEQIPFSKYYYMDDKTILRHFINKLTDDMKRFFLQKFYQDTMMIETLKVYLDANLNMVHASQTLYIHRNTLIQRLEKFHQTTGFDARLFKDALLIYHLIN